MVNKSRPSKCKTLGQSKPGMSEEQHRDTHGCSGGKHGPRVGDEEGFTLVSKTELIP